MSEYYEKYIKYKNKYINLQSQLGGLISSPSEVPKDIKRKAEATKYFENRDMQDTQGLFETYVKLIDDSNLELTWPTKEVLDEREKYYQLIGKSIDNPTLTDIKASIVDDVIKLVEALLRISEKKGTTEDNDLIKKNKDFLILNKEFLEHYNLFPEIFVVK
jgi:hypothetical protein